MSKQLTNIITKLKITDYSSLLMNFLKKKKSDKQILDPLTTIIKIALLSFYEKGSKLSIINNKICIQEPTFYQGTVRWTYGDSRCKLYNLREPIEYCMLWFPYSRYKELKDIYLLAIDGLKKLKESYNTCDSDDYDLIDHLIDYYIKIINENFRNMEKKVNEGLLEQSVILNDRLQGQIKKIWKKEDILLINGYFNILKSNNNNNNRVFDSINVFLDGKDEIIQKFIKKYSTEL
jgi:hypothetical protein